MLLSRKSTTCAAKSTVQERRVLEFSGALDDVGGGGGGRDADAVALILGVRLLLGVLLPVGLTLDEGVRLAEPLRLAVLEAV